MYHILNPPGWASGRARLHWWMKSKSTYGLCSRFKTLRAVMTLEWSSFLQLLVLKVDVSVGNCNDLFPPCWYKTVWAANKPTGYVGRDVDCKCCTSKMFSCVYHEDFHVFLPPLLSWLLFSIKKYSKWRWNLTNLPG